MELQDLASRVALAFGIGLLIGLERGWRTRKARPGGRTAGVRTFALSGLLGGISAAISRSAPDSFGGTIFLGMVFVAYAGVIVIFHRDENRATNTFSATSTVAALVTFILGAYALIGDVRIAAASAIAATGILIVREELHEWIAKITLAEFESALILLAMTFIALPLIPDRTFDNLAGLNPRQVWLIAILLATVSFAGYVSVKLFGEKRGILLTAAAGGLVSSTAVAFSYAKRASLRDGHPQTLAGGAALATAVSFVRVAVIVAALKRPMIESIAPALSAAALILTLLAFIAVYWRAGEAHDGSPPKVRNPFAFWSVIGVAATMAVLIVVGRLIGEKFGTGGVFVGAAAMGLFDVDAMTVSITQLVPAPLTPPTGADAILIGVIANLAVKALIAVFYGGYSFAIRFASLSVVSALIGALGWWFGMSFLH